jgi:putative FmdB family regulatory protein
MPLYTFECSACGATFDRIRPFGVEETVCEACSNTAVRSHKLAPAAIFFKGPGFYSTDRGLVDFPGDLQEKGS